MNRLDRQSFLGADSDRILRNATVGIVGLGGGGSHAVQQFAHLGIGRYVIVDPDVIEDTNTNRLVGGTLADVAAQRPKVDIAVRIIQALQPDAVITPLPTLWQHAMEDLKGCDVIVGAVDSYAEREQLERFCRRFLIPYIDMGMGVVELDAGLGYLVSGQVIASIPGQPCLKCCHFITPERLEEEAARYGVAGGRPQVVWPNGVLASTAVGLVVNMLTPWHTSPHGFVYLEYDGNIGTVKTSSWKDALESVECSHYRPEEVGDPLFNVRKPPAAADPSRVTGLAGVDSLSPLDVPRRTWVQRLMTAVGLRQGGKGPKDRR